MQKHLKIINDFEKKKMLLLTKKNVKSDQDAKLFYICGKRILWKLSKSINCWKVRDHCYYTGKYRNAAHSISDLKFNVLNEIPVVFHNCSNYHYHFTIKELANKFEGKFEWPGENTEKYKIFSVPIEKEIAGIDKDGNEIVVTISYIIKFIDSAEFTTTSLSNLVDNLTEGIHEIKWTDYDFFLEYEMKNGQNLLHELHNDLPFLPERINIEKSKSLLLIYLKELNILFS